MGVQADGGPGGELALQDFYRAVAPLFQVNFFFPIPHVRHDVYGQFF